FQVTTRKRANPTDAGTTSKKLNLGAPIVTVTLSEDEMDTTSNPVTEQPKPKLVPTSSKKNKDKLELSTGASTTSAIADEQHPLEPGKHDKAKKKRKSKQDEA
ncbi:hypothetical protein A2U01_0058619, partial [Trifolium medium]|nr:hypothetical protein [Trifolium medium]